MREKHRDDGRQKVKQKWIPPDEGSDKLNVDSAFTPDGHAGAGMILRNWRGELIFAASSQLQGCDDALEAELAAMEEGLNLAVHWSTKPIVLESDCAEAIKLVHGSCPNMSRYAMRINSIRERFNEREIVLTKVSREANCVSHGLARMGRVEGRSAVWLQNVPSDIAEAMNTDCSYLAH
ncbi:unnamed protein product [Alopecurus aequalis]